jgi:SagB-type dehydrogenase family enzyme
VSRQATPFVRSELYGDGEPALDDPAELYHEASKLYPALAQRQSAGLARLAASEELRIVSLRAVRRNPQLPSRPLPRPRRPRCSLWKALDRRRTARELEGPIDLRDLATLLDAAYGRRPPNRRTVPSGGALYPLELYVAAHAVRGLPPGVHRYDTELHALERHAPHDPWPALERACPFPGLLGGGAAALLVLAVFGRTRFKYGQRGFRFALLEAGHLAQNAVLCAAALGVPALPLGGFYDGRVDELVGADGVEESVVYAIVLGGS